MATKTLGTNATNTLTALSFSEGASDADFATIAQSILDDINNLHPVVPGAYTRNGVLFVPNRGFLVIRPGDWVGVDGAGWPVLVSANVIATSWTHS